MVVHTDNQSISKIHFWLSMTIFGCLGQPDNQGLDQEMIKGSPNLLIVGTGQGLGSSHNAIWWNLAIYFYIQDDKTT